MSEPVRAAGSAAHGNATGNPHPERASVAPVTAFAAARLPRLLFGPGRLAELPALVAEFGPHTLVVTGSRSFTDRPAWATLRAALASRGVAVDHLAIGGEPSPDAVDAAVADRRADPPDCVVGIGGGSALDAAKAIAGLLRSGTSALDHLEGVGRGLPYPGPATPFIAVPTTAGTGSEATRNAVLSGTLPGAAPGTPPFKKSFRDDRLVAAVAVVDPDLLAGCPPHLIAGDGLDALTQCLEAYTSVNASPFTDGIAREGLVAISEALPAWYAAVQAGSPDDATAGARSRMAWGALASGIALANAGLGAVHGIVAAVGAAFPIHHGTGCGALLAPATRTNIAALEAREPSNPALRRYAEAGRLAAGDPVLPDDAARAALIGWLDGLTATLALPGLGAVGVTPDAIAGLVAESRGSSMKTNPIVLTDDEIAGILRAAR